MRRLCASVNLTTRRHADYPICSRAEPGYPSVGDWERKYLRRARRGAAACILRRLFSRCVDLHIHRVSDSPRNELSKADISGSSRSARFTTDDIDLLPPPASQELDADIPKCGSSITEQVRFPGLTLFTPDRSTTYHLSAHLMLLASRVMSIYAVKPGVSLEARKSEMAEIHLKLETWCDFKEISTHPPET